MAKRVRVNADQFVEKHARRTNAALEDMRRGIERVDEAPGAKAADQQDKMRQKLMEAIDSGKWARRTRSVTLQDWKDRALSVGVGRVSSGLEANKDKVRRFAEALIEHENELLTEIDTMPDLTLEDSINRASTWIRRMAEFEQG